jgi:DNA-binding NarL/FixJ family response regulator
VGWKATDTPFDAIEVENATPGFYLFNQMAHRMQEECGLPGVGSSDAHILEAIGRAQTGFPGSGEAALRRVPSFAPDVAVMDVSLPGMSGIEVTCRIREAAPTTAVVILTLLADDDLVLQAVRAGASGYLLKNAELEHITAGIRSAAAGHSPFSPRVARALVDHVRLSREEETAVAAPDAHRLSERERQVLALLARGCDNAEIGRRLFVSPSTVKNHVSRVLEKLAVDNRVQAAIYAVRHRLVEDQALSG